MKDRAQGLLRYVQAELNSLESLHAQGHISGHSTSTWDPEVCSILQDAAAFILEKVNGQRPLIQLPDEILQEIALNTATSLRGRDIHSPARRADEDKLLVDTFWRNFALDSIKLLPLSHTCRRLRRAMLSSARLWSYIHANHDVQLQELFASRSQQVPISLMARMNTATLSSGVRNPIREIHLTTGEFTPAEKLLRWNTILQNRCSTLETFSFSIPNDVFPPEHAVPLALSEVHTPELRHVYLYRPVKSLLWDGVLPKLTHLAIWKLTALDSLATILTHCPSLESLSLMDLCDLDTTRRPVARTIGPSSRLRRILLYDTWNGDMQDAVLALLQGTQPYRALQIYYRASGYNFSYDSICRVRVQCHILERPVRLEVGMYVSSPQWPNGKAICGHLTVTAVTSKNCYRVGRRWQLGNDSPLPWVPQMLSPEEGLSDVRELWLVNITENVAQYAIVAKTLPALETIALVFDIYPVRSHAWSATVTPDLSILPHVYWPDHCPSLNTLRIICGFSDYRETVQQVACIRNEEMGVPRLDLSRVLAQLRSQSSKYSGNLEHIVIQATPQVAVNSDELKQLERYFTTVRLEYVDELPSMPLPEYCVEPEMNVSQKWRGLLW